MRRRDFLQTSMGAALAAAGCVRGDRMPEAPMIPIVDTHQHLWDLEKFRLPWLSGEPPLLNRSYVTRDYLEATKDLHVAKSVYMEVDVAPEHQVAEAAHVIGLSRSPDHPTCGAVIAGRPATEAFRGYMAPFKDVSQVKGVRQVLHVPDAKPGLCLDPVFVKNMRLLGDYGKSFDLCMRPSELGDAVKLADLSPDTRFILDHCGNADPKAFLSDPGAKPWHGREEWTRGIEDLAKRKNVVCKISGIVVRAPKGSWTPDHLAPIINRCLDAFGPDRVVFGSDWPVCTLVASLAEWVGALKEVIRPRPETDRRKLLHDNAMRLYSLA